MSDPNTQEDLPFVHYTLKHRLIAWISQHLFDSATYTVRHGLLKGMKRKGGLGWVPAMFSPGLMTAEQQFWRDLNLSGMTVYDVGAFHGLLTLFFASRAKAVVCFEPNTPNHKRLMENLMLNGVDNVKVRKVGVGSRRETCNMVASALMPGGASIDGKTVAELLRAGVETVVEEISIVTLDEEIPQAGLPTPDFIKIDIEGWEIEALRGARNTLELYKPAIFLEMHGETLREKRRKVSEIVAFLWEINYRRILHVETGATITPENTPVAMQGHLYCRTT
ncbi:FkbM family methyltransferase [Aminobacter anthyllidis]|uniref:FkbM family methyltransferase n=1 Tax=Aminobacter anthyllidis TaxID=1035067 RepID=A0A9X1D7J5_9HYPH|nr:FkbM family methyltransferase [Aminobacter anthyllidis]MBT1159332.1 FkbM family methyltransferase [Aminobacter anthyllidis]